MNSGPTLALGATGPDVSRLQRLFVEMKLLDYHGIDGDFGPMTEAAVRAYQGDRGVPFDGIVGDLTWWVPAGAAGATLASLAGLTTV